MIPLGVQLEETNALQDAAEYLYERGIDLYLLTETESSLSRDRYNAIKKRDPEEILLHAYPVVYNPTEDQLRRAGIRENVDVIATLATKHITDNDLSYEDIDTTRFEVKLENNLYTINYKNQINHFSHVYLNIVLGLFKK